MSRGVTLKDVAARVGLTPAAVSLALRGQASIPEATRQRVVAAAEALGYVPNAAARALRTRRHHAIGVLVFDQGTEDMLASYSAAVLAVAAEAMRRDCALVLVQVSDTADVSGARDAERPTDRNVADLLARTPVDGLVGLGAFRVEREAQIRAVAAAGLPYAFVGVREVAGVPVPHVTTDYVAGSRMALEHLARLGHRRIALAVSPYVRALPSIRRRIEGYLAARQALGLEGGDELILEWEDLTEQDDGAAAARAQHVRALGATAVYAVFSRTARQVLHDLHAGGLAVPGDVAVVGFGDFPGAASMLPPLTVVRQPLRELGAAAAQLVFAALDGVPAPWPIVLEPDLVVRHSCGAAARTDGLQRPQDATPDEVGAWE